MIKFMIGGIAMSQKPTTIKLCPTATQVWTYLTVEQRAQVIGLMARMAFNFVVAQATSFNQESQHVLANQAEDTS